MKKPFNELTRLGKIRRLRNVVYKALESYDLQVESVKFLTIDTNTMYVVQSVEGERFVLRIYSDDDTTIKENQAEIFWLVRLLEETDLKISEPVQRRDGKYLTLITIPDVPPNRRCILFKWIPGRPLEENLSPEKYYQLGQSMAKLHIHARSLNPLPGSIYPKRWNKVFYYPDEPVVYNTPDFSHLFSKEDIKLLDRVVEMANKVLKKLYEDQEGLILIHGDLHFWNVHYYQGELYLLDFEDINLGYPIQDIAVTLYYGRSREGYKALRDAFKDGYTSLLDWPPEAERIIPVLWIARTVMFMNYVAWLWEDPTEFITSRMEDVREFLGEA